MFLLGLGVQVGLGACMFGDLFSSGEKGGQRIQVRDKGCVSQPLFCERSRASHPPPPLT